MKTNKLITYHILNITLLVIFNNCYDWQGKYFLLGLTTVLIPNMIGIVTNFVFSFVLNRLYSNKFILYIQLFLVNELSFSLFEKRIILFGLIQPVSHSNEITPDNTSAVFISLAAIISIVVIFIRDTRKEPMNFEV
ncbi:MAG TPA: hypothetical protein PLP27_02820 [Crocinitomicaceae bacterium]|nr:hypothetical protein [Crocinitomicaceae bacterium]